MDGEETASEDLAGNRVSLHFSLVNKSDHISFSKRA